MFEQKPIPKQAISVLSLIPHWFKDDGCTNSPDSLLGFEFKWACRLHDWRYCSRCHHPRDMVYSNKKKADKEIKKYIRHSLPWMCKWVSWVYWYFVWKYGGIGAWNSCGPAAGRRCRHNMEKPEWFST